MISEADRLAVWTKQLNLPGFHWHAPQGVDRWTIRVTGNWRITFGWDRADAVAVDLEDYH